MQRDPETAAAGRHGQAQPVTSCAIRPLSPATASLKVTSPRRQGPSSQFELQNGAERRNLGEAYHGSGWVCSKESLPSVLSPHVHWSLRSFSFPFYHELLQCSPETASKFGGQCSGVWKKGSSGSEAPELGTEGTITRLK